MPLYGHELSEEIDPITAGLPFAVTFQDRSFIGDEALQAKKTLTPTIRRVGLKLAGRRAAREGAEVLDSDGRVIGQVTSGTFSPTLQTPIAMAYIAAECSTVGSAVAVDIRGTKAEAQVVALPFYKAASQ
jgi:aminomethyltransferase